LRLTWTEKTAQIFHHIVAKLLYLCRRQDIQTAVASLCTRVKSPDNDYYKKLARVIQYLRGTQDLTLTIELDDHPNWWVDSSYAVHPDMRSHSGIIMTLGKGAIYSSLCKQKLNTKSSTEGELVGIDDAMGQVLWTRYFLAAQGLYVPTTTIHQDNKSTILLAENGRASSSKRTRHLNVRYNYITDQVKKGHVKVAFCATQEILADFFTKPLQGALFMRMRQKILNLPSSPSAAIHRSVLEERTNKEEVKDSFSGEGSDNPAGKANKTKKGKIKYKTKKNDEARNDKGKISSHKPTRR